MKKTALTLLVALALAGCSSQMPESQAVDEPAAVEATSKEPVQPTEPEISPAVTVEIECSDEDYESHYYTSPEEAWPAKYDYCEGLVTGWEMTELQKEAVTTAYGEEGDVDSVGTLYGLCAAAAPEAFGYLDTAGSPGQIAEVKGALVLCPDHPLAQRIKESLSGAKKRNGLRDEGRVFGSGLFRVGEEIEPGTYYTRDVEGCYWERTDANGQIIDNYFTNAAARVQVTIQPSDYSFSSESCGEWQPVE